MTSPFVDRSGQPRQRELDWWDPVVITRDELNAEADRLASLPAPPDGRRESLSSTPAPASRASAWPPASRCRCRCCCRARPPGRSATTRRRSASASRAGAGHGRRPDGALRPLRRVEPPVMGDLPPRQRHRRAPGAPLVLQRGAAREARRPPRRGRPDSPGGRRPWPRRRRGCGGRSARENPFGTFPLTDDGAWLMPYERLIDPPAVASPALHWPWHQVKAHLDKLGRARRQLPRPPPLPALQPGDRAHERHHPELLRHDDDPAARNRRPPPPPRVGRHQLLLPGIGRARSWPGAPTTGGPVT